VGERQVRRLQRERLIDRRNGRTPEGGDGLHRPLFTEVPANHLVDLVDLDGGDEERLATLDIGREAIGIRATGEVLDPAARIDQDQ
jgi:hypothetical protein